MSVEVFLEYLSAHKATTRLATKLREIYVAQPLTEHEGVAAVGVQR